jgi:hypothetical protein
MTISHGKRKSKLWAEGIRGDLVESVDMELGCKG